ncbi:hypothetical protein ES708_32267 [subsurface metagenome]
MVERPVQLVGIKKCPDYPEGKVNGARRPLLSFQFGQVFIDALFV